MGNEEYRRLVQEAEVVLLEFLRAFEDVQNNMRVERLGEFQAQVRETTEDGLAAIDDRLSQAGPPEYLQGFHDSLAAGLRHCGNASRAFLGTNAHDYSLTAMDVRRSLYRGLQVLYGVREHTPALANYWVLPDTQGEQADPEDLPANANAPVGVIHHRRASHQADYSLYVPESYTPSHEWPLIVGLHGAYGRGDHFLWSWLRPAKSRGYMVLAPKSLDVTWSILQPERDTGSVAAMLEEVCEEYAVDRSRVFLSGLSDGGTFTYLLGLSRPDLFAGIAPIAADFSGAMDDMLRRKQGIDLPIYIVHGAQDHIFPVAPIRSGHTLLNRLGYNARYEELPNWGHSYCSYINEQLVMPWFEGLGAA